MSERNENGEGDFDDEGDSECEHNENEEPSYNTLGFAQNNRETIKTRLFRNSTEHNSNIKQSNHEYACAI